MLLGVFGSRVILVTVIASATSLAGSFYFSGDVAAAFCLGISFALLSVAILVGSYEMHARGPGMRASTGSTSSSFLSGTPRLGDRSLSLEIEIQRDTGSRLSGVLTATNRGSKTLGLSRLEVVRPTGCRLAIDRSEHGSAAASRPVSVDFSAGSSVLDAEVTPGEPCAAGFFVLLPEGAQADRSLHLNVLVAPDDGAPFRRRVKAAIPR